MPHSWYFPTTLIQEKVAKISPRSVLDIGTGFGKWGFLLREQLDWNLGRVNRDTWQTRIVGIEVFPYESPLHSWVYDTMIRADVLDVIDQLTGFDLVVLSDVIEHIDKQRGKELLRLLATANRNVLVSTPLDFFEQEIEGNQHEHHISHWTMADFEPFVFDYDSAASAAMVVTIAGAGATWPTRKEMVASRRVYRIPILKDHSALAQVAKRIVERLPRSPATNQTVQTIAPSRRNGHSSK